MTELMPFKSSPKRRTAERSISISVSVHLALREAVRKRKESVIIYRLNVNNNSKFEIPQKMLFQQKGSHEALLTLQERSLPLDAAAWSVHPVSRKQLLQPRRSRPPNWHLSTCAFDLSLLKNIYNAKQRKYLPLWKLKSCWSDELK